MSHQRTIHRSISCEGIGLHTGERVRMTLRPAPANSGIVFRRVDLPGAPVVEARPEHIADVHYATTLAKDGVSVRTVEHLMAALAGLNVDNATVEMDGPEVPAMDGSALPFVALIRRGGLRRQLAARTLLRVRRPIAVDLGDRSIRILPAEGLSIEYRMRFDHPALGAQAVTVGINPEAFVRELAPCRTYGFLRDVEYLRGLGLVRGGSLENAIVVGDEGVLNGPLRFQDELVRHKALDLLGDLYVLGRRVLGAVVADGAGHLLHARLVRAIHEELLRAEGTSPLTAAVERWVAPLLPRAEVLGTSSP